MPNDGINDSWSEGIAAQRAYELLTKKSPEDASIANARAVLEAELPSFKLVKRPGVSTVERHMQEGDPAIPVLLDALNNTAFVKAELREDATVTINAKQVLERANTVKVDREKVLLVNDIENVMHNKTMHRGVMKDSPRIAKPKTDEGRA
jgi:hypothetical protein